MSKRAPAVVHSPSSELVRSVLPHARKKNRLALAEGERTVLAAFNGSWPLQALILENEFAQDHASSLYRHRASEAGIAIHIFTRAAIEKISDCETAPPVALLVKPPEELFTALTNPPRRIVVLDRIGDPGNAGTLIRSAVAFGFSVVLTAGSVSLANEKLIRSSAGHCFLTGAAYAAPEAGELRQFLAARNYKIAALSPHAKDSLSQLTLSPTELFALVLGNETAGVDESAWVSAGKLRIPMRDDVESLNVAMSGSIALYELSRGESL